MRAALREPWAFEENAYLHASTLFVPPGTSVGHWGERSLGTKSSLGRYLRAQRTWPALTTPLEQDDYEALIAALTEVLRGAGYLVGVESEHGEGVQLRSDALVWRLGEGQALPRDPIRTQRMNLPQPRTLQPNRSFSHFYRETAATVRGIEGREHTGQVG